MAYVLSGEAPAPASRPSLAFAAKGFRPFFVLAAAYAVVVVPLWLGVIEGKVTPSTYLEPSIWHAHEMIFGFAVAVVAGFLLTAVGNWTQRETLVGAPLLVLAGIWVAGRIAMLVASSLPRGLPALVDLALLPLLAASLLRPLVATKNRRNLVMPAVLLALFATNLVVHLDALGVLPPGSARRGCALAVDLLVLVMLVIAGRVFPMFTRNATGVTTIQSHRILDVATVLGMVTVTVVDGIATDARIAGSIAGVVGVLAAARAARWGARHSLREPLLWILHAGYAWLVVGLLMRALGAWSSAIPMSLPIHALTAGAIGSLTLGMMARVSLGHTGRALVSGRAIRWAFVAVTVAALSRVVVPLLAPAQYRLALIVAGGLWSFAFGTFLAVYAPMLARPRADGRAG